MHKQIFSFSFFSRCSVAHLSQRHVDGPQSDICLHVYALSLNGFCTGLLVCVAPCWPDPKSLHKIPHLSLETLLHLQFSAVNHTHTHTYTNECLDNVHTATTHTGFAVAPCRIGNFEDTPLNTHTHTTQPLYAFLLSPSISPRNNQRPYGKHIPTVHWLLRLLFKEWAVAWLRGVPGASLKGEII